MTNNLSNLNKANRGLYSILTSETTSGYENIDTNIGDSPIASSMGQPKIFCVLFDSTCSLNEHVSQICQKASYQRYFTGKIRKNIDKTTHEKIIPFAMTPRLGSL